MTLPVRICVPNVYMKVCILRNDLQWGNPCTCTTMKPQFKGKTASMYSRRDGRVKNYTNKICRDNHIHYTCHAFQEACSAGHRASSEARSKVCSLSQPDGRFNILAAQTSPYMVSSSSCSWHAVRGVVYAIIAQVQSLVLRSSEHAHCTYWQS